MTTELYLVLAFLAKDLDNITSKDSFEKYLDQGRQRDIQLIEEKDFFDFPYKEYPLVRDDNNSYTYVYRFKINHEVTNKPIYFKAMYLNTIHGPWIVIDLLNKETINEVGYYANFMNDTTTEIGRGIYQHNTSKNFIKLTYYPAINKYAALIANTVDLFNHPLYSWNKVLDHLQ